MKTFDNSSKQSSRAAGSYSPGLFRQNPVKTDSNGIGKLL